LNNFDQKLEEEEYKPTWTEIVLSYIRWIVALITIFGLLYLSGVYQLLFYQRTAPTIEQAQVESVFDAEIIALPLRVFVFVNDEDWFILIHVAIEYEAAPAINGIRDAILAAMNNEINQLECSLVAISTSLEKMIAVLKRMPENCSPNVYYKMVRPWIMYFENVIYEGVEELGNRPQTFRGETGAQSSIIPSLIAGLNIKHEQSILTNHLKEMRLYMPPGHRAFIEKIEENSRVKQFVIDSGKNYLKEAYNTCLRNIFTFRDIHLDYAHTYIHQKTEHPKGTGATPFMPWLNQLREETERQYI